MTKNASDIQICIQNLVQRSLAILPVMSLCLLPMAMSRTISVSSASQQQQVILGMFMGMWCHGVHNQLMAQLTAYARSKPRHFCTSKGPSWGTNIAASSARYLLMRLELAWRMSSGNALSPGMSIMLRLGIDLCMRMEDSINCDFLGMFKIQF